MPAGERQSWLGALRERDATLADELELMLREHEALAQERFLEKGPMVPVPSLAGQSAGAYTLLSEIGRGGMGSVWLAERSDGRFTGNVAVKLLNPGRVGRQAEARFRREGTILASLRHPHIAQLLDAGHLASGQLYLVLEHVNGQRIDVYCDERRLSVEARLHLFLDVVAAVGHAHSHLVVHRDIKPSNVLVGQQGTVKLLDFGIAKLLEPEGGEPGTAVTRDGEVMLTPDYAAPEQLVGEAVTTRTDVYALGVLLYVILSGQHPAGGANTTPAELMRAIMDGAIVPLSEAPLRTRRLGTSQLEVIASCRGLSARRLQASLRGDLENIVAKALKRAPAERYASAEALAEDVRRFLSRQPVSARPDALVYRAGKFLRRNRAATLLGAAAAVALLAGLAGTATQARRATRQAARAEAERARADEQRDVALRALAHAEAANDLNLYLMSDAPAGHAFTAADLLARAEETVRRRPAAGDDIRVELLIHIGDQYLNHENMAKAGELLREAHGLARTVTEPSTRSHAACSLADFLRLAGDLKQADPLLAEGFAALPDAPQYGMARVQCLLVASRLALAREDVPGGLSLVEQAGRLAAVSSVPSPVLDLDVSIQAAVAYQMAGRTREAIVSYERAYARFAALGRDQTERAASMLNDWGMALLSTGRPLEAEQRFRESLRIVSGAQGRRAVSPNLLGNLARALREVGQLPEALSLAQKAHARAATLGEGNAARRSLVLLAILHREMGELDRAERLLDSVEAILRKSQTPTHISFAVLAAERSSLALARGDQATASVEADRAVRLGESSGQQGEYLPRLLLVRAEAALAAGAADHAEDDTQRAVSLMQRRAEAGQVSNWHGQALLTHSRSLQALGRSAEARIAAAEALRQLMPSVGTNHPHTRAARELSAPAAATAQQ